MLYPGINKLMPFGVAASLGSLLPAPPMNLVATPGSNNVVLAWDLVSGATSYIVLRSTWSGDETTLVSGITSNNYTDTTVINGITYFYTVIAVNANGNSVQSNEVATTPFGSYYFLDTFTDTNGTNLSAHQPNIGKPYSVLQGSIDIQNNRAHGITDQGTYVSDIGLSDYTISMILNRGTTDAGNLPGLIFRATDNNNFWFIPFSPTQFVIYQKKGGNFNSYASIGISNPTNLDHTIAITLNGPNMTATYDGGSTLTLVDSFNMDATEVGIFSYSLITADDLTSTTSIPTIPTGLSVSVLDSAVKISWDAQAGMSFNIYESTTSNGESNIPVAANLKTNIYYRLNLVNGTTYYWKIKAVGGGGESAYSSEVNGTPVPYTSSLLNGLLFYAELNEASGTTRVDVINGNNLSDNNTVGQGNGINVGEHAADFNGINNYLSHGDASQLKMGSGVSATVVCWILVTGDTGAHQTIISKDDLTTNREYGLELLRSSATNYILSFTVYNNNIANMNVRTTARDFTNKFHMVAGIYDSVNGKIGVRLDGGVVLDGNYIKDNYTSGGAATTVNYLNGVVANQQWLKARKCQEARWNREPDKQEWLDIYARGKGNNSTFSKWRTWRKWNNNQDPRVLIRPPGIQAVIEPRVWCTNLTTWRMAYTNIIDLVHSNKSTINVSSSRDGINWAPGKVVLGNGTGGELSFYLARPGIYIEGNNIYLSYADIINHKINLALSTDNGRTFNRIATDILPPGTNLGANTLITKDGLTYVMSYDYIDPGTGLWSCAFATATAVIGPYTNVVARATTLGATVATSRVQLFSKDINGLWHGFFHRSRDNTSQANSIIFHATNPDYTTDNWTIVNGGAPIINMTEAPADWGSHLVDQNADPFAVDCLDTVRCYYDIDYNGSPYMADICMAFYPGTKDQMLADAIA